MSHPIRLSLVAVALLVGGAPRPRDPMVRVAAHAWAWISPDDRSANGAVIVGDSIALAVDPGLTPAIARRFLARAAAVTGRPVRYIVLTHWHPDHALGITCQADRRPVVVAQDNARRALTDRAAAVAAAMAKGARTPAERLELESCRPVAPDRGIASRDRFDLGGRTVEVFHPGPAHTDGDLIVWEPTEQVLVTGDIFMHSASPAMGEASPMAWVRVLDSLVALEPAAVVAGHFGPSRPRDLLRFRDYLKTLVRRVTDLVDAGVLPDSVPSRIDMSDFKDMAQYPQFDATFAGNARRVVAALAAARR